LFENLRIIKIKKTVLILLFFFGSLLLNSRTPDFVPDGASWRIDINPYFGLCTMKWYEISKYYDNEGNLLWGQGQCGLPGFECHCYDWLTWWFGITWVPDPPEGWKSIFGVGENPTYNPITGKYEQY
jgi:hypothetical protein